jgi:hypothetical protein
VDSAEEPWSNHGTVTLPAPLTRWTRRLPAPSRDWSAFPQLFANHWEAFQHAHPRDQTPYDDRLGAQRLAGGHPDKIGDIAYRCLPCGQGTPRVAMSCQASWG